MVGYYVLGAFLVFTLAVGLWAGRNVRSMKDYALANRSLGIGVLTMTMLATYISQGDIYEVNVLSEGGDVGILLYACFLPASFLFVAYVIAPRLVQFKGCLTMGDMMGQIYGRRVQMLTGLIGFVFCCLAISANMKVLMLLLPQIMGLKSDSELQSLLFLSTAAIVVLYACFGGMRSIAITDVLQFMAAVLVISLLVRAVLYEVHGFRGLCNEWQTHHAHKVRWFSLWAVLGAFCWAAFPAVLLSPPYLQRMLMAQNKRQLKKMLQISLVIGLLFYALIQVIGLGAVILSASGKVQKTGGLVLVSVINSFFGDRPLLVSLIGVGLVSILVSTIDSFLHAGGLCMTNDVLKRLFGGKRWHVYEILYTRLGCFILGTLAILAVKLFDHPYDSFIYGLVPLSATTIPLIMGVLGFKVNEKSFFIAFLAGLLAFFGVLIICLMPNGVHVDKYVHWLITISVHTIVFLASTYWNHGGLIRRVATTKGVARHVPEGWTQSPSVIATSTGLVRVAQERVRRFGYEPSLTGLFLIVTYLLPFVSSYTNDPEKGTGFLLFGISLHLVGMVLCLMLLVQHYWPKWLQPYFPLFWYCTLLYCIPFCTALFFFREPSNPMIGVHITVHVLLLISLVDFQSFVILSGLGTSLAALAHVLAYGQVSVVLQQVQDTHIDAMFRLIYGVVAALAIGYLFAYRRERYQENRLLNVKMVSGGVGHEVRNYLQLGLNTGESIKRYIDAKPSGKTNQGSVSISASFHDFLKKIGPELSGQAKRTGELVTKFTDVLQRDIAWYAPEPYSLRGGVKQALGTAYFRLPEVKAGLAFRLKDDFSVALPSNFLEHILVNLVKNAYIHGEATQVTLTLDSKNRTLSVQDNGKGIPKAKVKHVFDLFYTSNKSLGTGLGLTLVQDLMRRCGGNICCVSKQGKDSHTTFILTFPEVDY